MSIDPGYSESCHLDCVSADGLAGFNLRIARYPVRGTAMLWAYVFLPDAIYRANDDALSLGDLTGPTETAAADVTYTLPAPFSVFMRRLGTRDRMTRGEVRIAAPGYRHEAAPAGAGPVQIAIEAVIEPRFISPSPEGRLEAHGSVEATLRIDGREAYLAGLGQWHEEARIRGEGGAPFTSVGAIPA